MISERTLAIFMYNYLIFGIFLTIGWICRFVIGDIKNE